MWFWEETAIGLVVVAVAFGLAMGFDVLMPWLPLLAVVTELASVLLIPRMRHARWRWELGEEELELRHGIWKVTWTVVPLTRIQHVAVQRTGWTRTFGLVVLRVHTAAGATTIPGLQPTQADDVRDRILARLRTPDDL
jgi:membrane protein YdbS with pleckstrin-like domain